MDHPRPDWNEVFLKIASTFSERSTCSRAKVGCVLASVDNRIISTGYNGGITGTPHCTDVGCILDANGRCIRSIHAEQNAIFNAAEAGNSLKGCIAYVTHSPCWICARSLTQCGVSNIIYALPYRVDEVAEIAKSAGVELHWKMHKIYETE